MKRGVAFTSRRRQAAGPPVGMLVLLVLLVGGLGVGWWFWLRPGGSPADLPPAVSSEGVTAPEPGEERTALPPLGASDAFVRDLAGLLSRHPRLASWLVTDDLVRRFVEGVVALAQGSSPVPALEVMIPDEPFEVQPSGGRLLIHERSYARYGLFAEALTSIDTDGAVRLYAELLPLIEEAYYEISLSELSWRETLAVAVRNVQAVQVPAGPLEVVVREDRYVFADARLESLTPAEKHVLRLGPDNAARVQGKVRELWTALEAAGAP